MKIRELTEQTSIEPKVYTWEVPVGPELFDTIKTECSDIINELRQADEALFRGVRSLAGALEGQARPDRRAKDGNQAMSDLFNALLAEAGFAATRQNSVFTTTNLDDANTYKGGDRGSVFYLFPKNGYEFTYTTETDIVLEEVDYFRLLNANVIGGWLEKATRWAHKTTPTNTTSWGIGSADAYKELLAALSKFDSKSTDYEDFAWLSSMIRRFNGSMPPELVLPIDRKYVDLNQFIKSYQPSNTNLRKALVGGLEIYFKCEYYLVNLGKHGRAVREEILNASG
jgi:hypothetical protein